MTGLGWVWQHMHQQFPGPSIGTDTSGLRVTISESIVSVSRSSPAASKTFGSSDFSGLIFEYLVNPDHVQPSQLSHRCPDKIILGHGHQIVAVREPTTTRRLQHI